MLGVVNIRGESEAQIHDQLLRRLGEYLYTPEVDVFVTEYHSRVVAVAGMVQKPAVYTLATRNETLSELINRAGGLTGGVSNGEPIVVHGYMKPISTLLKPLATVDLKTKEPARAHYERSDICVVPAAGVVGEAMVALVLTGVLLEKFGSDSMAELHRNVEGYLQEMRR